MGDVQLNTLPLGFRFRPTDEELVDYYLRLKINGNDEEVRVIREIDICKWEPWDLPDLSVIKMKDSEWFFFCPKDQKYPNGRRSNRATIKGYWKATGKDRKIMSGVNLIGMKRSLVFHMGRAPKGKRTNWIIHEYRATENIHDFDQGAYVLCRLFKKQDETIESLNYDEVEPNLSSSTVVKLSPEYTESEVVLPQASPELGEEAENTTSIECYPENSDGMTTTDTLAPIECHSNSYSFYDAENQGVEVTGLEVDPQLEEELKLFYDPEPLDCKLFSPLHSQMQAELGSSCMYYPVNNDNSHSEVHMQYGTNEDVYISEFLNSVINNSDDYSGEDLCDQKKLGIGSRSESEAEMAKLVFDPDVRASVWSEEKTDRKNATGGELSHDGASNHMNAISNRDNGETGIRIRPRRPQSQPDNENSVKQGIAPRRIRLQCKLQIQKTVYCSKDSNDSICKPDDKESEPIVTEVGKAAEEHTANAKFELQMMSASDYSMELCEISQDLIQSTGLSTVSKHSLPESKRVTSVLSKTPAQRRSFVLMFRAVGALVLFIMFVTISRSLIF